MKKTGAWLVRYALEQIGVTHTFGIPGVHNTEIYDGLNQSELIRPILVICGGIRTDSDKAHQLHEMDQHALLAPITKKTYKIETHEQIVPAIYEAYQIANAGEPGPVFVEVPVNLQLFPGKVSEPLPFVAVNEEVKIDYSKRTRFTKGIVKTNLGRFTLGNKARFVGRALLRKVTG